MSRFQLASLVAGLLFAVGIYTIFTWPTVVLIAGWYVYRLFYPRLLGVMDKRHKGEQVLSFVLPWLLIGPLLFWCGMWLLRNPSYAALVAGGGLIAFELVFERYWLFYVARLLVKRGQFVVALDIYLQLLSKFDQNGNLLYHVSSNAGSADSSNGRIIASITHQLAIRHHRRAIELEQEGQTEAAKPDWQRAIAYWVLLMEMDAFWQAWQAEREAVYQRPINPDELTTFRDELTTFRDEKLYERLRQVHHDFEREYGKEQQTEPAAEHKEYRLLLKWERSTAMALRKITEQLRQQGQVIKMPVYAGPLMLGEFGLLEQAREVATIAQNSDIADQMELAHSLADYLSPFGRWRVRIEEQVSQQLIDQLKTEHANEQTNPTIRRLLVRALIKLGQSLDSPREAASKWMDALKYEPNNQEAQSLLVKHCIEQATRSQGEEIERAINTLRFGLKYAPDNQELKQNLSALLTEQAKQYIEQEKQQEARENLAKAVELDKQNEIAKEMLANL